MESLGNELKAARAKKNLALERIADEIRINPRYLRSLEEAKYSDLPGGMYNRAFLRAYCECLGLDPKEMILRYEAETAPVGDKAPKSKKVFRPASSPQPHPLLMWSVILLATVVGLYFSRGWITAVFSPYFSRPATQPMVSQGTPPSPATVPPTAQIRTEPAPAPAAPDSTSTVATNNATATPQPQAGLPAPTPEPKMGSEAARPDRAGAVTGALPNQPEKALRIRFHVVHECWLSVSSDGKRVFVDIVKPGDDRSFDANERLNIILGNAGGVTLTINGKPAKPLGKIGEVLKIEINTSNLAEWLE
jgi:cytoskeleton protein RodZ